MVVGGQRHTLAALGPGKSPGTHWTGDWVGPSFGLDGFGEEKMSLPTGVQTPKRPDCGKLEFVQYWQYFSGTVASLRDKKNN